MRENRKEGRGKRKEIWREIERGGKKEEREAKL